ncbi:MAG: thermonuclease family protein [Betaproteobacteria bacterium]|nr:MAG: thermonuclease family protein [Betaproteobacteria bacterium]
MLRILRISLVGALCVVAALASAETARVRHALDGDSLMLDDGRQLRLIGINAPEMGSKDRAEQPLARAARTLLANLVDGQTLRLRFDPETRDRYGRMLAYAQTGRGDAIDEILLRLGLAWMVAVPPNVSDVKRLRAAEDEARRAARGVWNEPSFRPLPADALRAEHSGFRFITGRVSEVREARHAYFLALAPNVVIAAPREYWKRYFDFPARALRGELITVRGWLKVKNTVLRMRLEHPAMLTLNDAR